MVHLLRAAYGRLGRHSAYGRPAQTCEVWQLTAKGRKHANHLAHFNSAVFELVLNEHCASFSSLLTDRRSGKEACISWPASFPANFANE